MPLYFLLVDGSVFRQQLAPALTAASQRRRFAACRPFCEYLLPALDAYHERYHLGPEESLVSRIARGDEVPFDPDLWRLLVGEALLYAAAEMPEFQTAPASLYCLAAPDACRRGAVEREQFAPIQQAHYGRRDLLLGGFYRPDHAGYNDPADVARLAHYLAALDPEMWQAEDLAHLPEFVDPDEQVEELAFARECLDHLRTMYLGAERAGQVVVCEEV